MGLFKKPKPLPDDWEPATVALVEPDDAVWQRQEQQAEVARRTTVTFEPKPADLVAASVPVTFRVTWSREAPTEPGLYWVAEQRARPYLAVVVAFGGRLGVWLHGCNSTNHVSVTTQACWWAGPIATPSDIDLEDLRLRVIR